MGFAEKSTHPELGCVPMTLQEECNGSVNQRLVTAGDRTSGWVEEDDVGVRYNGAVRDVEHIRQRPGDAVEGAPADTLAGEEDVFDEACDGTLVGNGGVDGILVGPWGDHHEGKTRTIAATALSVEGARGNAWQGSGRGGGADADACAVDNVGGGR